MTNTLKRYTVVVASEEAAGAYVLADAAAREIAKRDQLISNLRNALTAIEKDARQMNEASYDSD